MITEITSMNGTTGERVRRATRMTTDIIRKLREPFDPMLIKWKVQTNPREGDEFAMVVSYVDARDVAEKLDMATGGDWSVRYEAPPIPMDMALMCHMTVCGITRSDIGTASKDSPEAAKEVVSDAFKRAAVLFGVGSHLYRFPKVKAKVEKVGKGVFLTFKAQEELLVLNRCLIEGNGIPRFSEIKVWGNRFGADGRTELFVEEPERGEEPSEAAATMSQPDEPDPTLPPVTTTLVVNSDSQTAPNEARPRRTRTTTPKPPITDDQVRSILTGIGLVKALPNGVKNLATLCGRFGLSDTALQNTDTLKAITLPKERITLFIEELRALYRELDALKDVVEMN